MASFTDQISQFNPYISQIPVETMAKVGMQKQAQYDAGVQKIQGYIDNIAGIDIYKDEHKQYLQTKLNELGSKLKTVAAGDFSNQQLVNSVGGMAGSIVKDPIVQNAIYSTQKIRKGDAEKEAAHKAGKSSPNNDQDWNDQKASWLNDKNINSIFNGGYNEFYDVDKTLIERAEKILSHPDEYVVDNPWQADEATGKPKYFYNEQVKDASGKPVKDKNGNPVTREVYSLDPSKGVRKRDDAMTKISIKGTSSSKLFNNFLDSIDSRAAQQLRIDAKAKYRGLGIDAFSKDIVNVYNNKKEFQSQEIVNLSVALKNPDLTSVEKTRLTARLTALQEDEKNGVIDKELSDTLHALKNPENLDKYKTEIYTQQHLMNMAKDMSARSYKQEINDNPYTQMYMKKQDFVFSQKKFADESLRGWKNIEIAKDRLAFDKEKDTRDWLEKHPEYVVLPGTLPTGTTIPTIESEQSVLTSKADAIIGLENKFASILFPGMTDAQRREGFNKLVKDYATNPKAEYSPDQLDYLKQHKQAEREFINQANLVNTASRKAKEYIDTEIKTKVSSGGEYSSEDIVKIAEGLQKFKPNEQTQVFNYFKNLEGGKYFSAYLAYYGDSRIPKQKEIKAAIDNAIPTISNIYKKSDEVASTYLTEHNPMALIQRSAINMSDATDKAAMDKFLTGKASEELSTGGTSASTVLGWDKPNETRFELQKSKDGSSQILAISADGKSSQIIKMKTEEQNLFPRVKKTSILTPYIDGLANSENHTTNTIGRRDSEVNPVNAVTAGITGYDLPLLANDPIAPLVRFDIEGNPSNNGTENDTYSLIMYVHPPGSAGWKGKRMHSGYVLAGGIANIMNGVNNVGVQQAMKTWK